MTNEELAEIEARANAATPGPWRAKWSEQTHEEIIAAMSGMIEKGGKEWHWVDCDAIHPGDTGNLVIAETGNGPTSEANARFIANARPDMLKLIEEIRLQRIKIKDLEGR